MKTLIERFIGEVAYTMDVLNNYNPGPKIDPIILFTGSLILTIITSFSTNLILPFIAITYSLILIIVLKVSVKYVLRIKCLKTLSKDTLYTLTALVMLQQIFLLIR